MLTTSSGEWKWASNSCFSEKKYLVSSSTGLILASDGKTLTKELEGNAWIYDEVEKTLKSESGNYLSDQRPRKKAQIVRPLQRNSADQPLLWFQWNVTIITDCVEVTVPYGDYFQLWNLGRRKRVLAETDEGTVTMLETSNGQWKWASNSCFSEKKYLISSSSGLILASDGKTLTKELEGNAWIYDEVEKTLKSESGNYLSDQRPKDKAQIVRPLQRNSADQPFLWFQWNVTIITDCVEV